MTRIVSELERLADALDRIEAALAEREQRHRAELEAMRQEARAERAALADRIDGAVGRLEAALEA
jgi:hypothetical protein